LALKEIISQCVQEMLPIGIDLKENARYNHPDVIGANDEA